jgi:hypothetical protein
MIGSWSVGHAQAPARRQVGQFEIMVETPRGPVKVTCATRFRSSANGAN